MARRPAADLSKTKCLKTGLRDTQKYTALMYKYAAQISIYTYLEKQKYFLKPF